MLYFELNLKTRWKLNTSDLTRIFKTASRVLLEKNKEDKAISIVTVNRREMRAINKQSRGIDAETDILTFTLQEKDTFVELPYVRAFIGELIICPAAAKAKAKELAEDEAAYERLLVAHGLLHIFGLDHKNESDTLKMKKMEQQILAT